MALLGKETVGQGHPKYWPLQSASNSGGTTGTGIYSDTTFLPLDASAAWALISTNSGAAEFTASKSANTYYTYVDISDCHGAMGTIIFPITDTAATGFFTVKLTTDGVVEEFRTLSATLHTNKRHFLGFARDDGDAVGANYQGGSGYGLSAFTHTYAGIHNFNGGASLRSPEDSLFYSTPLHLFNESLKVEVKCSLGGSAAWYVRNGGVFYISSPNL
jgi:hypothetical protein